jgi:hypothetical protein
MKELSNDLFFPILGIILFVSAIYAIKYKEPSGSDIYESNQLPELNESWSNLDDSRSILDPNSKPGTIVNNKCECPTCPQVSPQIPNAILPSYQSYNRDYRVLADPLYPPEQRSDSDYYFPREVSEVVYPNSGLVTRDNPMLYGNGYFRYPTRGSPPPYQMKGYLVDINNPDNIVSLFGRPKYLGSSEFQYYVSRRDANNNDIKIDIPNKREIFNDERVKIKKDIFNGDYKFVEYKTEDLIQPAIF